MVVKYFGEKLLWSPSLSKEKRNPTALRQVLKLVTLTVATGPDVVLDQTETTTKIWHTVNIWLMSISVTVYPDH